MSHLQFTGNALALIQAREATPEEPQAYEEHVQASKQMNRTKWSPASRRRVTRPSSGLK